MRVLQCDETVTLVRNLEKDDGGGYACTVMRGVSWFAKTAVVVSGDGAKPVNTLKARIPANALPEGTAPQKGDYLVRGALERMERPAELLRREYFQVTAVGDNRRGRFPHWAVSGA